MKTNKCLSLLVVIFALLSVHDVLAQVTGDSDSQFYDPKEYPVLQMRLQPPKFWRERAMAGTKSISFTGPGEDGIFPKIEIFTDSDAITDLYEQRMLLRNRVRAKLISLRADRIEFVEEYESNIKGREILEQTVSYMQGHRELNALAYHFLGGEGAITFLFTHSRKVFDIRVEFAREVFESIVLEGEDDDTGTTVLIWAIIIGCGLGGFWYWFSKARAEAIAKDRILDVKTLQRIDYSKGFGDLVIGDEEADLDAPMDADTGFKILDLSARKKDE